MKAMLRSKQGISPLVATVILIAFAVAIALVIMKLFQTVVEDKISPVQECEEVALKWFLFKEHEDICYDGRSVKFRVENAGSIDVFDLKLLIIGEQDMYVQNELRLPLITGDVRKMTVEYAQLQYGPILEVRLVPYIKVGNEPKLCAVENGLSKEAPPRC